MGLTFELIIFIASILFGILWYWRESNGNGLYRFFNKILNSKELQMKSTEKKGFVYKQSLLLRFVFVTFIFLLGIVESIPDALAIILHNCYQLFKQV